MDTALPSTGTKKLADLQIGELMRSMGSSKKLEVNLGYGFEDREFALFVFTTAQANEVAVGIN
jgi:hypothetical protein